MPIPFLAREITARGDRTFVVRSTYGDLCKVRIDQVQDDTYNTSIELTVTGTFGPYYHLWSACGTAPWWEWLEDMDMDYFLKKTMPGDYKVFDFDRSKRELVKCLKDYRRQGEITKTTFRDVLEEIRDWDADMGPDRFMDSVYELTHTTDTSAWAVVGAQRGVIFTDYWEHTYFTTAQIHVDFWERVWRPFIEQAERTEGFAIPDPVQPVATEATA